MFRKAAMLLLPIIFFPIGCMVDPASRVFLSYDGAAPTYVGQVLPIDSETNADDISVSWSISTRYPVSAYPEARVATVDSSGRVTLRNYGTFTVTASTGDSSDSINFTFYADPALVGTWTGAIDTLVLHESGVLDQPASTQNGAWYSTETEIFLENGGRLMLYELRPLSSQLWIDLNDDTIDDGAAEIFN